MLSMFTEEVIAQTLQAYWDTQRRGAALANENAIHQYMLDYQRYGMYFEQSGGDPEVMEKIKVPVVPTAWAVRATTEGFPEMYDTGQPLIDPPLPLPKRKEFPENNVVFGAELSSVGYPGWYASSVQNADGTTSSTSVAVGTEAKGPDGKTYVLTAVGFARLAKYWVLK